MRFIGICGVLTLLSPFIPFIALIGLCMWPFYRSEKSQEMAVAMAIALLIFSFVFVVPIVCFCMHRETFSMYAQLVDGHEISYIEVFSPFGWYEMLLYLTAFGWVVSLNVEQIVDASKRIRYSKVFRDFDGEIRLVPLAKKMSSSSMTLIDLVKSLEGLPGWVVLPEDSDADEEEGEPSPVKRGRAGSTVGAGGTKVRSALPKFASITSISSLARQSSTASSAAGDTASWSTKSHPVDYLTFDAPVMHKKSQEHNTGDYNFIFGKLKHFIGTQVERCLKWPLQTMIMIMIAAVRAMIPRLWIHLFWGFPMVPHEPTVAAMCMHSIFVTFFGSALWLILFNNARLSYAENLNQVKLVSALVNLEKRHTYLKTVALPNVKSMHEYHRISGQLPYMQLNCVDHIIAWWLIREYALIDTMDERVTLEITMLLVLGGMFMTVINSILDFLGGGEVSAFQVLAITDIIVLGCLALLALYPYYAINCTLADQANVLVHARHGILTPESRAMDMSNEELRFNNKQSDKDQQIHGPHGKLVITGNKKATDAAEFLTHLSEVIRADDLVQTLFGVPINGTNLAQVCVSMLAGLGSAGGMLYKLVH